MISTDQRMLVLYVLNLPHKEFEKIFKLKKGLSYQGKLMISKNPSPKGLELMVDLQNIGGIDVSTWLLKIDFHNWKSNTCKKTKRDNNLRLDKVREMLETKNIDSLESYLSPQVNFLLTWKNNKLPMCALNLHEHDLTHSSLDYTIANSLDRRKNMVAL